MANGHQLELAIKDATNNVAREGWENADLREVTLAGFGYVAHEVRRPPWTRLRLVMPVALAIGAGFGEALVRLSSLFP